MGRSIAKGFALFLIITIGVAAGNLISDGVKLYLAAQTAKAATAALNESNRAATEKQRRAELKNQKQRAAAQAQAKAREAERKRRAVVKKQLQATCDYWTKEYVRTREYEARAHRDVACRDARQAPL